MAFLIVPDFVHDAINAKIDAALAETPEASDGRRHFYEVLLDHYNRHGELPEFTLVKRTASTVDAAKEE